MRAITVLAIPVLLLVSTPGVARAESRVQEKPAAPAAPPGVKPADPAAELKETQSITKHVLTIDGVRVAYTATAGTMILRDADGKPRASVFSVSYVKDGVDDPAGRPVTYAFNGYDRDSAGERPEYDPSGEAFNVGYVSMLNDYLRRQLNYETDQVYEFSARVGRNWTWDEASNRFANVAEDLRSAMNRNPSLRILFTSGYFDLATPYFDTPFSVAQMALPKPRRANISIEYYQAGHMMYVRKEDHAKLKHDVAAFIKAATARP